MTQAPVNSPRPEGCILVIDSEQHIRAAASAMLRDHAAVQTAVDGKAAARLLRAHPPDLVLMEVGPWARGFLSSLRREDRTSSAPVVLLVDRDAESPDSEVLRVGAEEWLAKPFGIELVSRIRLLLELARLRRERKAAERANRNRDQHLARIAHSLTSPIFAMRMWLETLANLPNPEHRSVLQSLRQCLDGQSALVNELVDTARLLLGNLPLVMERVNPADPVRAAVSELMPEAKKNGLALSVDIKETTTVNADAARLHQVVRSLVANAIQFTPAGGKVDVVLQGDLSGVFIRVRDTGCGFAPAEASELFNPFRGGEGGGRGLGLALARQVVMLHGGTVRAESAGKNQGALFEVWLPAPRRTR